TAGRNVVVVTPTASGKTLCYNLPVLGAVARDESARALYLFPTKALAADQLVELRALADAAHIGLKTHTYDGDTPANVRSVVRAAGQVVITNPDMLHAAILPHHTKWFKLFENLRYVVIDELHTYRGLFGSNVANVIRRLRRICHHYGADPVFICASATIANPRELAERILEADVELIDDNGAPSGRKHVLIVNPPVVNPQLWIRSSSLLTGQRIAERLIRDGVQTIAFARSRTAVEILTTYLREALPAPPGHPSPIQGYRGGYLPNERRDIERDLRDGRIRQHELLLRMRGYDGDVIGPAAFLPLAERFGLAPEIDRWVVARAIALLGSDPDGVASLSVNLSGASLNDTALLRLIETEVARLRVDSRRLTFEITETAAVANIPLARRFAERLMQLGCRFALDDFGSGFGSFYYLKHLPFDFLKIDGEFVSGCLTSRTDQLVIEAVVRIARGLGKETIAEFVSTPELEEFMRAQGVDYAQGFEVGRPVAIAELGLGEIASRVS
nr:EAL domain-containing protein [Solirubrobacterales bacterium]